MPKILIDTEALLIAYARDRTVVRKFAAKYNTTIQTIYARMKEAGIEIRSGGDATKGTQARENNPNWKDGTTRRKDGYILQVVNGKQVSQHRLVAEKILGRKLRKKECVHHKNGDKSDNRPENLEVFASHAEHMKKHCDPKVMRERGLKGNTIRWAALKARRAEGLNELTEIAQETDNLR